MTDDAVVLRGRHLFSAIVLLFLASAPAAALAGGLGFELGQRAVPAVVSTALVLLFVAGAIFFFAAWRGRWEKPATAAGIAIFLALTLVHLARLAFPFRYVLFGRLWPEIATDVEALVSLTIFAVHWNAWLVARQERAR